MKKAIFIISAFLFFAFFAKGQNDSIVAPKEANTIVIQQSGDAYEILFDYAKRLQEYGYIVKKLDRELLSFHTEYKLYKNTSESEIKIKVFAKQKDNTGLLDIRGEVRVYMDERGPIPYMACNCGSNKNSWKSGFNEILKTLEGYNISDIEFFIK